MPAGPERDRVIRSWRWHEARKDKRIPTPRNSVTAPTRKPRKPRDDAGANSLKAKIDAHDSQFRVMGSMLAGDAGWSAACNDLDKLADALLSHPCQTLAQLSLLTSYARSVGIKISREMMAEKLAGIAEARRKSSRTFDNPQTTYEVGIVGSDRVPVVAPIPGNKSKYHRKYPLDIMEIGEEIFVPGIKKRAEIGGPLAAAQSRYNREFTTKREADGLRVRRVK